MNRPVSGAARMSALEIHSINPSRQPPLAEVQSGVMVAPCKPVVKTSKLVEARITGEHPEPKRRAFRPAGYNNTTKAATG
jgi:hypothetical protein